MWQHGNRATLGYSSDITTSWRLKALARDHRSNEIKYEKILNYLTTSERPIKLMKPSRNTESGTYGI